IGAKVIGMNTLLAVTEDLAEFVFIEWFGFRAPRTRALTFGTSHRAVTVTAPTLLPASSEPLLLENGTSETPRYVSEPATPLFSSAVAVFDGILAYLPYGARVYERAVQNRWSQVRYEDTIGWIVREKLSDSEPNVQFLSEVYYGADSNETEQVRAFIDDSFAGKLLAAPLQDVEYVTYRLKKKNLALPWGTERPRTAGAWQRLLRGKAGVHISITPNEDSIMEVVYEDDTGHVLFVDAVLPDQSLLVSEIGYPDVGQFYARTMTHEEWRELHPVFIAVS
ncbi:MAG: hypothetical protein R3B69_00005, partial [Candidatus Paceibacterota bacterium]